MKVSLEFSDSSPQEFEGDFEDITSHILMRVRDALIDGEFVVVTPERVDMHACWKCGKRTASTSPLRIKKFYVCPRCGYIKEKPRD